MEVYIREGEIMSAASIIPIVDVSNNENLEFDELSRNLGVCTPGLERMNELFKNDQGLEVGTVSGANTPTIASYTQKLETEALLECGILSRSGTPIIQTEQSETDDTFILNEILSQFSTPDSEHEDQADTIEKFTTCIETPQLTRSASDSSEDQEMQNFYPLPIDINVASVILKQMESKRGATFNPSILTENDLTQYSAILLTYFYSIKTACITEQKNTDKTFIIAGDLHWSCCQIRCCLVDNTPTLKIFFLDSLNTISQSTFKSIICNLAEQAFGKSVIKYESNRKLQKDSSCKIFALMFARMLHSLLFGKFKHKYNYDLWAYLEQNSNLELIDKLPAKLQQADQTQTDSVGIFSLIPQADEPVNSHGKNLGQALTQYYQTIRVGNQDKFRNIKIQAENDKFRVYWQTQRHESPTDRYTIARLLDPVSGTSEEQQNKRGRFEPGL